MPSTLADFLAAEETLARLRKRIAADPSDARRLRSDERALVQMLTRRWDLGLAGWLTADEARAIALELVSESDLLGLAAQAVVEDRDGQPFLVYRGSRYGDHVLALASTGPVAARSHWLVYLTSCPRRLQVVGGRP